MEESLSSKDGLPVTLPPLLEIWACTDNLRHLSGKTRSRSALMEHIRHDRLLKSSLINWGGKGGGGCSLSRAGESGGWMDGWHALKLPHLMVVARCYYWQRNQNSDSYCWFSINILKTGVYSLFFSPLSEQKRKEELSVKSLTIGPVPVKLCSSSLKHGQIILIYILNDVQV